MKKILLSLSLFTAVFTADARIAETVQVTANATHEGWLVQRIWLEHFAMPQIQLSDVTYGNAIVGNLPAGAEALPVDAYTATLGVERKKPFLLLKVPVYRTVEGGFTMLKHFTVDVTEGPAQATGTVPRNASRTTGGSSPLATGNWFKIAVPAEGVYKIDKDFLSSIGISGSVASGSIRLFGNGGAMLPESNAVPHAMHLLENAIMVQDGGDGSFDGSDYFLFYSPGPHAWIKDSATQRFSPAKHLYADSSYYFLNVEAAAGEGLRMAGQGAAPTVSEWNTSYSYRAFHENDLVNPGKFGKNWLGDEMSGSGLTRNVSFSPGTITDSIKLDIVTAGRSFVSGSKMSIAFNGAPLTSFFDNAVGAAESDNPVDMTSNSFKLPTASGVSLDFTYTPGAGGYDARAFIDRVVLNTRASLQYNGRPLAFRDWRSINPSGNAGFRISNANADLRVWDVTDITQPVLMNGSLAGGTYSFSNDANYLHEYIAYTPADAAKPVFSGTVANQNLQGLSAIDLVIVSAPQFLNAAERLAQHHRTHDGMTVAVATTTQVYNEFSSGAQDISAIRDFMKMLYDDAGMDTAAMPSNLLLFGDASYDYKNRIPNNTNYVPTFESAESVIWASSYILDDFFAFLDDHENVNSGISTLDIGVSRIPVASAADAEIIVDKIIHYTSPASLGPWKINNTYVADNIDNAGPHLDDAEIMSTTVNSYSDFYTDNKIYLDNLPFVSSPGGIRCPDGTKALNDAIFKGTFIVNYSGHGNPTSLAEERVLTTDEFSSWQNLDKMPFMMTATCDFSRFDNPSSVSAGEKLIVKPDGGAIAMLTTIHQVFAGPNRKMNSNFLQAQFTKKDDGSWNTFGEAYRIAKNNLYLSSGSDFNTRMFVLLGDPALQPAFPEHTVALDSVMDIATGIATDSLKALGGYTITGHVVNADGSSMPDFNGKAYITIYDKENKVTTPLKVLTTSYGTERTFKMRNSIIYKGTATVTNGVFSASFIAPEDINYDFGLGKIIFYAENGITDAAGADSSITVGGYSDNPYLDDEAPIVKPYIGDSLFIDGGITGSNTLLYATISDETGINVSGTGIGHDLVAILDGDESKPYILNDYYETVPNSYKYGIVQFPVKGLPDGPHTFTIKAWDVNNNSGEGVVSFVVVNGDVFQVNDLMNYPNPFSTETHFVFRHNHPYEKMNAKIAIYDASGRMITILEQNFTADATSRSNEIVWDGKTHNGTPLTSGVYPYRLILTTEKGVQATAYQKLVFVR